MTQLTFPSASSLSTSSTWHGTLDLQFAWDNEQSLTCLNHAHAQSPLKVQRPFYPEGSEVCHTVMLHTAGGVVGGDRLSTSIHLQPQTHALLTTAAATKIYGSVRSGHEQGIIAQQATTIQVDNDACLEWFPQETILFDGASFQQSLRVDLAPGALWLGWEITRLGRTARGEKFQHGHWRSHIEVWQNDRPLWIDPQQIAGGSEMLESWHGLAGYPVVASFSILGRSPEPNWLTTARQCWPQQSSPTGETGVTQLMQGLLCRYRGQSTTEARRWFTNIWQTLRPTLIHRSACCPRVWPQ